MRYEDVYAMVGDFGVYQACVMVSLALIYMFCIDAITMIFVGADIEHWCRIDRLVHLPFERQKDIGIPPKDWSRGQGRGGERTEYSSCQMYDLNYSAYSDDELYGWNRTLMIDESTPVIECAHWIYDQSTFVSTIVSRVINAHINMPSSLCRFALTTNACSVTRSLKLSNVEPG